jgi:hypothetical protein
MALGGKMTRRFAAALVFAALAGLILAFPARAALCLRWESPPRANPGQRVAVAFRTLIPLASGELKPHATLDYPFRVEAVSPSGETQNLQVAPTADPQLWRGLFVAAEAGAWVVRVANFEEGAVDRSCYRPLVFQVGDASGGSGWWRWAVIATGALLAVAVAFRRSRLRRTL